MTVPTTVDSNDTSSAICTDFCEPRSTWAKTSCPMPSLTHPMGTDGIGHDVFAQVLRGSQKSVQIALLVSLLSTVVGTVIGAVAGYYRGVVDNVLMRFVDLVLTVPLIAILAVLGARVSAKSGNWLIVALVLAGLLWAPISRIVRGLFLSLREKEY